MHIFFIFFAYPPTEDNLPISMKHYPTADMQDSAKIKLNSEARVYWVVEIFCTYIVIFVLEEWKIFSGQMDGIRCEFLLASMLGHLGTIFSLHTNSFWTLTTLSNILGWCLLSVIIVVPWMWKIKLTSKQKKKMTGICSPIHIQSKPRFESCLGTRVRPPLWCQFSC